MNTIHIQHWHRHYRVREPQVATWESLASGQVLAAFDMAMTKVVSDDSEVVLLRRVALKFTAAKPIASNLDLAEQWGRAMATAVQEAIQRNDPANVRRFADVEEHVVCYLEAALNEQHADAWYFAKLRDVENAEGEASPGDRGRFDTLLEQHLERWPEILSRLSQRGRALPVLRRLSSSMQRRLWSVGIRGIKPNGDRESERPLFLAALEIVARLRGRQNGFADSEAAFHAYRSRPQPSTDWSDPTHLAEAVFAAVRFLFERSPGLPEFSTGDSVTVSNRIRIAIESLEWLDREWLQHRLVSCLTGVQHSVSSRSTKATPAARMEAAWDQVWTGIEHRFYSEWDSTSPASEPNCLLALALMVEQHASWVHDPALGLFIERKLAGIARNRASGSVESSQSLTTALAPGEPLQPTHQSPQATRTSVVRRPDEGQSLRVDHQSIGIPELFTSERTEFPTSYAGVFLLARGIHDLKLPSLGRQTGFPSDVPWAASDLLMRLACHWAQRDCSSEVDYGLLEFTRLAGAAEWSDLLTSSGRVDESAILNFQTRLAASLIGLRTWSETSELHIKLTENGEEKWLHGGNVTGQVFPWCKRVFKSEDVTNAIDFWTNQLLECSGDPLSVAFDESLQRLGGPTGFAGSLASELAKSVALMVVSDDHERLCKQTIEATASSVLRHWARGIRGFATSSDEFLLQQFIRRTGTIWKSEGRISIVMESRPLDVALKASGMLEPLEFFIGKELIKISFQTES